MKRDITTEEDIKFLVDSFYDKINDDWMLAPIFNDVAQVDWSTHLPIMYSFWSTLLLGQKSYRGQPFPKHAALPNLDQNHFDRWIALFIATLDELFEGPVTENAKHRALSIAGIFQSKLGITRSTPSLFEIVLQASKT